MYGYLGEVLTPIQSHNLVSMFRVGRSANAAAFGKAWDTWRDAQADPNSVPSELGARFQACTTNIGCRGYDVHQQRRAPGAGGRRPATASVSPSRWTRRLDTRRDLSPAIHDLGSAGGREALTLPAQLRAARRETLRPPTLRGDG